jgi:hypothetical protein
MSQDIMSSLSVKRFPYINLIRNGIIHYNSPQLSPIVVSTVSFTGSS